MPSRQGHQVDALHDFRHHVSRKSLIADEARSMMVAASRSPSRLSVRLVRRGRPTHGTLNSGRKVTTSSPEGEVDT